MNHRHGRRFDAGLAVELAFVDRGKLNGRLINISMTGAAILMEKTHLPELYTPCEMSVEPQDRLQPQRLHIQCFVVRIEQRAVCVMFMKERVHLINRLRFAESVDDSAVPCARHRIS